MILPIWYAPPITPPKPKTKRVKKPKLKEALIPLPEGEVLDEDAVFKEYFEHYALEIIEYIMPKLYAVIDKSVPFEFCEQELINFLRGRLRQIDKRKVADKLLKVKLLNGKDQFIYFHNEIQNALPDDLDLRWFKSRMLISLRYGTQDITTLIIFTGKAPLKKHHVYNFDCFGTRTIFKPNIFVAIKQNEKKLIASTNPTAMVFLAAKYAAQSKDDMKKRFRLKKKVFDLMEKKGFSLEDHQNIINFVFDYMLLPQDMEDDIKLSSPFLQPLKTEKMIITQSRLDVMDAVSIKMTGLPFKLYDKAKNEEIAVAKAEAEAAKEAAKVEAEAAKEAAKEATKRATQENDIKTIHAMLKADFSIERIADILGFDINYAKELARLKPISA